MSEGGFWNDQEHAQQVVQQVKGLRQWIDPFDKLNARLREALEYQELLSADPDPDMFSELDALAAAISDELAAFELRSLLRGPDDHRAAQVEISAGAGGTEARLRR
jgi:peptide chain release factor 2